MNEGQDSRREFLRGCMRYVSAGALTTGSVAVASRALHSRSAHECRSSGICRACPQLRGCMHPAALSAKQHGV